MSYIPKNWNDLPIEDTPITADDLDHIENGIDDVDTRLTTAETDIDGLDTILRSKTNTSVMPNDNGEVKTRYRISNKLQDFSIIRYYPLCKLPADNVTNYASAIVSGRIGGWASHNTSYINALLWNRDASKMSLLDITGTQNNLTSQWNKCELAIYTQPDTTDIVYIKANAYSAWDLDLELYQSTASILYDGTYTETPTGTLQALCSTATNRLELVASTLFVGGTEMAKHKNYEIGVEKETNEFFNDSRVYKKIIDIGVLPNNTSKEVETGLTNVTLVDMRGIATNGVITSCMPFVSRGINVINIEAQQNNTKLYVGTNADFSTFTGTVTLEYTKN